MALISIFTLIFIHLHQFQSHFFQFYPNSSKVTLIYPLNMMCHPLFILTVISIIHDPLKFLDILKTFFKISQFSTCFIQFHFLHVTFFGLREHLSGKRVAPEYCAYKSLPISCFLNS